MTAFEDQLHAALAEKDAASMRRCLRAVPDGALDLASNDYLGLARHPEVIEAACAAVREFGAGARASRLVSGHTTLHARLESELAAYKKCEAALVFPSGYHANLAVVSSLARRGDVLFCDKRNHASLIDACRLASANGAIVRYYSSPERLRELLKIYAAKRRNERFFIVSDTVFSMDGDGADLPQLTQIAAQFDAVQILDDAHGMGTTRDEGGGMRDEEAPAAQGPMASSSDYSASYSSFIPHLLPRGHPALILVGTLSKALGAQGGFVAGSRVVIDWLINAARPFIYTTGLAPASCGAAFKALEIVRREPQRCVRLHEVTEKLANGLRELGFEARLQSSPIIPVIIGDAQAAVGLSAALCERGVWCPAIRPPTVPVGSSRLRVTASAALSHEEIAFALAAFSEARKAVRL